MLAFNFFFPELIAYRPGVFIIIIIVVNGHIVHAGAFLIPKYAYTHHISINIIISRCIREHVYKARAKNANMPRCAWIYLLKEVNNKKKCATKMRAGFSILHIGAYYNISNQHVCAAIKLCGCARLNNRKEKKTCQKKCLRDFWFIRWFLHKFSFLVRVV